MTGNVIKTLFALVAFMVLFIGIPTDDGMYLGYFWKFSLYLMEVMA
jgi:hypothetical protein